MSRQITFIAGFTELSPAMGAGSIASDLLNAFENDNDSFSIVNSLNQVVATVTGLVPALRPVNIQSNTLAATTSFLKIAVDWHDDDKEVDINDVYSLVGNLAGIVGTIAVFAVGGGSVAIWAGAVGVAVAAAPLLWESIKMIRNSFVKPVYNNLWSENYAADYRYAYLAPDGSAVDRHTIKNDYDNRLLKVVVTPEGAFWSDEDYYDVYPNAEPPDTGDEDPGDEYQCDEYK